MVYNKVLNKSGNNAFITFLSMAAAQVTSVKTLKFNYYQFKNDCNNKRSLMFCEVWGSFTIYITIQINVQFFTAENLNILHNYQ